MYDANTLSNFPLPPSLIGLLEDVRDKFADTQKREQELEDYGNEVVLTRQIKVADLFVYGWTKNSKHEYDYITAADNPEKVFLKLLENPGTRSVFRLGIWNLIDKRNGGKEAHRPDLLDTKQDIARVMCEVIKEMTGLCFVRLDSPVVRDLIKYVFKTVGRIECPGKKQGQVVFKTSPIVASDIAAVFVHSGLFRVRGEGSDIPQNDLLMYHAPGLRSSTVKNVYTWSSMPGTISKRGQTEKEDVEKTFEELVQFYFKGSKTPVLDVFTFMSGVPTVKHVFSKKLIPFRNGVVKFTGEKSGVLIPWEEVERKHFDNYEYMFIDWKIQTDFPYASFDESTPLPAVPVIHIEEDKQRGLPAIDMTPPLFLNQIFEPEEDWEKFTEDELGPQSWAVMHIVRSMLQPYCKWFPNLFFYVDRTGNGQGNNGKGSIFTLFNYLATGESKCRKFLPATLAELGSGDKFAVANFTASTYWHISAETNDVGARSLDLIKLMFSNEPFRWEGKHVNAKLAVRGALSHYGFNHIPPFPASSLTDSLFRRVMVVNCYNSFENRARKEVEDDFLKREDVLSWFVTYAVMKLGYCKSQIFDKSYWRKNCPLILKNEREFFGDVSIVARFVSEVLEDNPDHIVNDVLDPEYVYKVMFIPWHASQKTGMKTSPMTYEKFLPSFLMAIKDSEVWDNNISPGKSDDKKEGPKKPRRIRKGEKVGEPENIVYELIDYGDLKRQISAAAIGQALKIESNYGSYGAGTKRALFDNWEKLTTKTIHVLCSGIPSKVKDLKKTGKQGRNLIWKKSEYSGGGEFLYPVDTDVDSKLETRMGTVFSYKVV